MNPPVPAAITGGVAAPEDVVTGEGDAIRRRRGAAGVKPEGGFPVGLALSGGGIRSATFCLGVLQAFAAAKVLRRFDYMSTVSGGGYIGGFLGRLYSRSTEELRKALSPPLGSKEAASVSAADLVERILTEPLSKPLANLRENGRYLSPQGSGDVLLGAAVAVRNWAAIQVVLGTLLLTLFLLAQELRFLVRELVVRIGGPHPGIFSAGWFLLPALTGLFLVLPLGCAYWLGQPKIPGERGSLRPAVGGGVVLAVALGLLGLGRTNVVQLPPAWFRILVVVAAVILITFTSWWASLGRAGGSGVRSGAPDPAAGWIRGNRLSRWLKRAVVVSGAILASVFAGTDPARDRIRNSRLSRWLTMALVVFLATLAFGVVDMVGLRFYRALAAVHWKPLELVKSWAGVTSGAAGLIWVGRKLTTFLTGRAQKVRLPLPAEAVASLAALALGALLLVAYSSLSWGIALDWKDHGTFTSPAFHVVFLAGFLASLLFGRTVPFLNQSSLQALYAARLSRAYLGASNPARWSDAGMNVTEPIAGDGTIMDSYRPHENGGPLHIVNVTLNETVSGKSQVEQRDRKGLGMAIGPLVVSVGRRFQASRTEGSDTPPGALVPLDPPEGEYAIFSLASGCTYVPAESLTLETWIAISGAAVSTGLGARTSLGLSILCGFFNMRLGYWWNSGMDPAARAGALPPSVFGRMRRGLEGWLPVQMHLVDEFLATFRGPNARRWYLTDGGHFENTGAYELIRRRLPLIVICDAGADPEYQFSDLANLVRKARLDFQTEISFLDGTGLSGAGLEPFFGGLEDLRRDAPGGLSRRNAALARVAYPDGSEGRIILLKPSLTGLEPLDVLNYHRAHPDFPQEPTSDQFFDEAQWESYRRLGQAIGAGVAPALASLLEAGESAGGRGPGQPAPRASA